MLGGRVSGRVGAQEWVDRLQVAGWWGESAWVGSSGKSELHVDLRDAGARRLVDLAQAFNRLFYQTQLLVSALLCPGEGLQRDLRT